MIEHKTLNEALKAHIDTDLSITFIEGNQDHRVLSYKQLYDHAMMLLFDYQQAGLTAGDQMIILHKDNQTFVEALWACILGGMTPVPVAVGISDEHRGKLFRIFNKLERPHLYTTQEHFERLENFAENNHLHESLEIVRNKTVFADLMKEHEQRGEPHNPSEQDTAVIQFSSGSTSEPKGVVLTHKNIISNLNAISVSANYTKDDVSLGWMPLTHDMGLIGYHLHKIGMGISQCLMPTDLFSRRPLLWMEKMSELKITDTCSPNFGFKHYLKAIRNKDLSGLDLSHVRIIYNGAEPISIDICEQFLETLKPYGLAREAMFTVYGLAEATLAVAFPKQGVPYRAVYIDRHAALMGDEVRFVEPDHVDAVGFAIEGQAVTDMEIKITDESNASLAANSIGLVQIKGPSVTSGYYMDEDANRNALTGDGWLNTGDLGFLTEQNELVITGREKDIIFSNGLNYYPHDIEAVALQLQELELGKVVAYGVRLPDAEQDTLLVFILFRSNVKDFIGIVRDVTRHINEQTGLEVEHVIPVNRIPKTTSGKLQRRFLGDAYLNGEYDGVLSDIQLLLNSAQEEQKGDLSDTEYKLKAMFEKIIEDKTVSVNDNFFETGISSLNLTEVHQEIDEAWPGLVDVTDMFEYQSITELASYIDKKSL